MLTTSCCLKVQHGIIALVDEQEEINTVNGHNLEVEKKDYGVNIIVGKWLSGFSRGIIIYCNDEVYKKANIYYER